MIGPLTKSIQDLSRALREYGWQGGPQWQDSQRAIQTQLKEIMATQKEVISKLEAAATTQDKVHAETLVLLQELQDAVNNQPDATPELVAATDKLVAKIDAQDALVEDKVVPQ